MKFLYIVFWALITAKPVLPVRPSTCTYANDLLAGLTRPKIRSSFFNILRARLGASLNDNFSIEYILPSFALEIYIIDIIWLIFISPRCGVYKSYLWKRPFFPPLWHPTQLRFFKFTWEKRANFRRKRFKICTITYFLTQFGASLQGFRDWISCIQSVINHWIKIHKPDLNRVWDICSKVWFMDESVVILSSKALRLLTIKS